jgi:hypothetical protein
MYDEQSESFFVSRELVPVLAILCCFRISKGMMTEFGQYRIDSSNGCDPIDGYLDSDIWSSSRSTSHR